MILSSKLPKIKSSKFDPITFSNPVMLEKTSSPNIVAPTGAIIETSLSMSMITSAPGKTPKMLSIVSCSMAVRSEKSTVSLPAPPFRISAPPPPAITSSPAAPKIMFDTSPVAVRISSLSVPVRFSMPVKDSLTPP